MIISYSSIFVAMISTFIAISILRPFAISIDLVDEPNERKKHQGKVPLIGGLGMFFGFLISVLSTSFDLNAFRYFFLASIIIVVIGVIDDHRDISFAYRILFQMITALIIVVVGEVSIDSLGDLIGREEILLNSWSVIFSALAIITAMNAVNMSDGIHGLAGLTSFTTIASLAYFSFIAQNQSTLTFSILLCAVIIPFIVDNLCIGRPKNRRVFMGDVGSMFIGLVIAWLLIKLSQGEQSAFSPVIALWLFSVPLIDTTSTILRRLIKGKSPFKADNTHLHHILLRFNLSQKSVLTIIVMFSCIMTITGIIGESKNIPEWVMFFGFLFVFLLYCVILNYLILRLNNLR